MRHQIDFKAIVDARFLDRLVLGMQADNFLQRQQMHASQVEVRVRRRKAVQMRTADRDEQQRIGMLGDLLVEACVEVHGNSSNSAKRRAFTSRALARS